MGVADFEEVFGKQFNAEEYSKAKQVSIVGELEPNNSYNTILNPRLYDKSVREQYLKVYGDLTLQQRQITINQILKQNGYENIQCDVLPGVDHTPHGMGKIVLNWAENNIIQQDKREIQREIK